MLQQHNGRHPQRMLHHPGGVCQGQESRSLGSSACTTPHKAKEVECIEYVHRFPSSTRDRLEKGQSSQSSPEPNCSLVTQLGRLCDPRGSTQLWYSPLVLFMSGTSIPGRAAPSPAMPRDWDPPGNTVLQNPDGETTVYKMKMDVFSLLEFVLKLELCSNFAPCFKHFLFYGHALT